VRARRSNGQRRRCLAVAQKGIKSVLVGARTPFQLQENKKRPISFFADDILKELSAATQELKQKVGNNSDMWKVSRNRDFDRIIQASAGFQQSYQLDGMNL